jgi:hypothetical protein
MTYHVVRYDDDDYDYSSFCILKSFDNEDDANNYCYDMGHLYIHAHVDYLSDEELSKYTN